MSNAAAGTVRGAALSVAIPPALVRVLSAPRSCALTIPFSCTLGDVGPGTRDLTLVVRGGAPGTHTIPVGLTTTSGDPNLANTPAR